MSVTVRIDTKQFTRASELARETIDVFRSYRGHYNNNFESHLRGKIGEIAVARWMKENGMALDNAFEDVSRLREADIQVNGAFRADVKTWSQHFWDDYGRCVSVQQLPKLLQKADVIIWCICPEELQPGMTVMLRGWNTMDDVQQSPMRWTGPPSRRQVFNHQLDEGDIRSTASLLSFSVG